MIAWDTEFWFSYVWSAAGDVVPVAVRARRLCDRGTMWKGLAGKMGGSTCGGGVAALSCVLVVKSDRAEMVFSAQHEIAPVVGEAFAVAMIGRSRALSKERWAKFRASLARGKRPFVVGGAQVVARLATWARGSVGDRATWARLANLFWWYRNRRGDGDLLSLLVRIREEKARLRGAGASWVDIARVSVCLKRRGQGYRCACPMCRLMPGGMRSD
jgi:hypothetical protein